MSCFRMRPDRAKGPMGWLVTQLHGGVDVLGGGNSSCRMKAALLIIGTRMRSTTKPGLLRSPRRGSCPISWKPQRQTSCSCGCVHAADDLHQLHHVGGIEEVHSDYIMLDALAISVTDRKRCLWQRWSLPTNLTAGRIVLFSIHGLKNCSTTKSARDRSLYSPVLRLPFTFAAASASIFPLPTSFVQPAAILLIPP